MKVDTKTCTTVHTEAVMVTMSKHEAEDVERFLSAHGVGHGHAVLALRDKLIELKSAGALR